MCILQVINQGETWYGRGTTWTSDKSRATRYETEEAAQSAKAQAKPFMKARLWKQITVAPC